MEQYSFNVCSMVRHRASRDAVLLVMVSSSTSTFHSWLWSSDLFLPHTRPCPFPSGPKCHQEKSKHIMKQTHWESWAVNGCHIPNYRANSIQALFSIFATKVQLLSHLATRNFSLTFLQPSTLPCVPNTHPGVVTSQQLRSCSVTRRQRSLWKFPLPAFKPILSPPHSHI